MVKMEFEVNGRKVSPNSISDAIEKAIIESVSKQIQEKVSRAVGYSDASKITIKARGRDLQSLSFEVSGPPELVDKVKKALR